MTALITSAGQITAIVAKNQTLAESTKTQYSKAIQNVAHAGVNLTDPNELADYAETLSKSSKSFLKAAIRLWARGIELEAKAGATGENALTIQAIAYRFEALNEAIQVEASKGQKAHTWLTQAEVKKLLSSLNRDTIRGQRDRIVLGLLVGAGLRREELATLDSNDLAMQPIGGRFRTVLNVRGKGAKDRVVPISNELAAAEQRTNGGNCCRSCTHSFSRRCDGVRLKCVNREKRVIMKLLVMVFLLFG